MLKFIGEHEKLVAFVLLGAGVMLIALLAYFQPLPDNSQNMRIIDAAMGALTLALGGAANALFKIIGDKGDVIPTAIVGQSKPVTTTEAVSGEDDGSLPTAEQIK